MKNNLFISALAAVVAMAGAISTTSCGESDNGPVKVYSVSVDPMGETIFVGAEVTVTATVYPENADNRTLAVALAGESVEIVNSTALSVTLKGVKAGLTTVTFTAADGSGESGKAEIWVVAPAPVLSITGSVQTYVTITASQVAAGTVPPVTATITASEKIENLNVNILTSSKAIAEGLAAAGLFDADGLDVANPGAEQGAILTSVGLANGDAVKGKTEVAFDVTSFIPMLFGLRAAALETGGDEVTVLIQLKVTDGTGETVGATIPLSLVDDLDYVSIAGRGFDIDQRVELLKSKKDETSLVVDVAVPMGITSFVVDISSDRSSFITLLKLALGGTSIDLANPGSKGSILTTLGLVNGEQVLGQTALEFDLTSFVPLLFTVGSDFSADFKVTITDAAGNSETKTVSLDMVDDLKVEIINGAIGDDFHVKIVAPQGIETCKLKLSSENASFASMLALQGFDAEFDLAAPGALASTLTDFGVPCGDAVKGQKEVAFNFTAFEMMLEQVAGMLGVNSLELKIEMTVADTRGTTDAKTITLSVIID